MKKKKKKTIKQTKKIIYIYEHTNANTEKKKEKKKRGMIFSFLFFLDMDLCVSLALSVLAPLSMLPDGLSQIADAQEDPSLHHRFPYSYAFASSILHDVTVPLSWALHFHPNSPRDLSPPTDEARGQPSASTMRYAAASPVPVHVPRQAVCRLANAASPLAAALHADAQG